VRCTVEAVTILSDHAWRLSIRGPSGIRDYEFGAQLLTFHKDDPVAATIIQSPQEFYEDFPHKPIYLAVRGIIGRLFHGEPVDLPYTVPDA
jgi:hypothetical protein